MEESKEYSTIVKCIKQLEIAFSSNNKDIALFLFQQKFITPEHYDEVNDPKSNLTDAEKATMLVTDIRKCVSLVPRNYHKLVDHLRQNIRYKDIVEILDKEYPPEEYPVPDPSASSPQPGITCSYLLRYFYDFS